MLVHDFLLRSAAEHPHQPVLIQKGRSSTYAQLLQTSVAIANQLYALGVRPGDRVGIYLSNSLEYVASYYGSLMAGAVTVPVNPGFSQEVFHQIAARSGLRVLLTEKRYHRFLAGVPVLQAVISTAPLSPTLPVDTALTFEELDLRHERPDFHLERSPEDLASIVFTSGSTGQPKGVMLSHGNLVANTRSIVEYLKLTANDRAMVVLPFAYVYGKSLLNTHVCAGGSLVLENSFVFPNAVLETMEQENVTGFAGVPSTFTILLERSSVRNHRFPSLRYVTQAGGPMPPSVITSVREIFAGKEIFIMYGATEAAARLTYLEPSRLRDKLGSIGRAIPGVTIEIQRPDGSRAAADEVGEIVAFGTNIMQGYWNDPAGTEQALRGGGYHTGDLAYRDQDGFLFITGRQDDMMKIGGHRVSPKEIEEIICEVPGVSEAAVVAVPDEILGQVPYAFIAATNPWTGEQQVMDHCRGKLAAYKVPRHVQSLDTLPKNENGKIAKPVLRESALAACG